MLKPLTEQSLRVTFWLGIAMFAMGVIITFVPGGERNWFACTGVLLLSGLFLPRWPYRIAALILVTLCIGAAIVGHQRGIEYRQRIDAR